MTLCLLCSIKELSEKVLVGYNYLWVKCKSRADHTNQCMTMTLKAFEIADITH